MSASGPAKITFTAKEEEIFGKVYLKLQKGEWTKEKAAAFFKQNSAIVAKYNSYVQSKEHAPPASVHAPAAPLQPIQRTYTPASSAQFVSASSSSTSSTSKKITFNENEIKLFLELNDKLKSSELSCKKAHEALLNNPIAISRFEYFREFAREHEVQHSLSHSQEFLLPDGRKLFEGMSPENIEVFVRGRIKIREEKAEEIAQLNEQRAAAIAKLNQDYAEPKTKTGRPR